VLLPLALPGRDRRHDPLVHPGDECVCDAVLLGGPTFQMMGPTVYNQFAGLTNWPFGAAMAFILMTATLLLT
jgi:putative spermidine/putrescine transport system permease protein